MPLTTRTSPNDLNETTCKKSVNYEFRAQSAPTLSLQQLIRFSVTSANASAWIPSGVYHPPRFHAYLSSEISEKLVTSKSAQRPYSCTQRSSIETNVPKTTKRVEAFELLQRATQSSLRKRSTPFDSRRPLGTSFLQPAWKPAGKRSH
ncbi:unnamed protein product [Rotaria sp. Silwood1]|nr:unnamed protein product [Rotaria sp. Silwood1]CAF1688968.1 unnamed protein product [Rotaria sp. Silwood1]CAF3896545.1 unnamed protein product [Rotaria sp. Silwood1]CAF5083410.1 unnamed protein product [Rotaria sp. Silwood1]